MATVADVARTAGVSKSTVSCVLSGRKFVSEELKQRVFAACRELNYAPSSLAVALATKKTNIVGLFLEDSDDRYFEFYNDLIRECVVGLSKRRQKLLIFFGENNFNLTNDLVEGKSAIDAGIVLAPKSIDERINSIKAKRVPLVVIGRAEVNGACCCVDVDNLGLVKNITEILIRKFGHRKILLINSQRQLTITEDREAGFRAALSNAGIGRESWVSYVDTETEELGYEIVKQAFARRDYTAVIVSSDRTCRGVYRALREMGLEIGRQVSVFVLGGEGIEGKNFLPSISYAHQNYRIIGQKALALLDSLMAGRSVPEMTYVKSEIYFSDSCSYVRESD